MFVIVYKDHPTSWHFFHKYSAGGIFCQGMEIFKTFKEASEWILKQKEGVKEKLFILNDENIESPLETQCKLF